MADNNLCTGNTNRMDVHHQPEELFLSKGKLLLEVVWLGKPGKDSTRLYLPHIDHSALLFFLASFFLCALVLGLTDDADAPICCFGLAALDA